MHNDQSREVSEACTCDGHSKRTTDQFVDNDVIDLPTYVSTCIIGVDNARLPIMNDHSVRVVSVD